MAAVVIDVADLASAVGADGELSMLDKRLLSAASKGLSPSEMSEELGGILSPAQAAQRTREILRSWDWLSLIERRALILMDMMELKEILMDRVRREGGIIEDKDGRAAYSFGDPRWASAVTKLLSEMNKLISTETSSVDAAKQGVRRAHAMVMVRAIEMAYDHFGRAIAAAHPEIEGRELRAALEESVPLAIETVDEAITAEDRVDEGGF